MFKVLLMIRIVNLLNLKAFTRTYAMYSVSNIVATEILFNAFQSWQDRYQPPLSTGTYSMVVHFTWLILIY